MCTFVSLEGAAAARGGLSAGGARAARVPCVAAPCALGSLRAVAPGYRCCAFGSLGAGTAASAAALCTWGLQLAVCAWDRLGAGAAAGRCCETRKPRRLECNDSSALVL